jgi:PTH1 family peptidyl-tRNA hydrolase
LKLIVGLGNPGRIYTKNRHNVGFMCLNHFARSQGISFDKKQGKARIGTGEVAGSKVVVARPQTGMNLSGQSVKLLVKRFNIGFDSLIVIHDDLDLPLGKIRISYGAGSSGHKGIDSIISHLKSQDFTRLRVGIGRPNTINSTTEADIIAYVLGDFTPGEKQITTQVIPRVSDAILCLLTEGLTAAMNKYN